jgi:hypothetical protein
MYPRARIEVSSDSRRAVGSRWRTLDPGCQALLVLAHLRNGDTRSRLAAGFGIGTTTRLALRPRREMIDLLAAAAADISWHVASAPESRERRRVVTLRRRQREADPPTQAAGKSPER